MLPDEEAIAVGCLRVIDESGEDYLYAKKQFDLVDLLEAARSQLLAAIAPRTPTSSRSRGSQLASSRMRWRAGRTLAREVNGILAGALTREHQRL